MSASFQVYDSSMYSVQSRRKFKLFYGSSESLFHLNEQKTLPNLFIKNELYYFFHDEREEKDAGKLFLILILAIVIQIFLISLMYLKII